MKKKMSIKAYFLTVMFSILCTLLSSGELKAGISPTSDVPVTTKRADNETLTIKKKKNKQSLSKVFNFFKRKKQKFTISSPHWANIVSIITGGLSLLIVFFVPLVGLLLAIAGFVFGIVGLKEEGKILGLIGLILGGLVILIFLIIILLVASFVAAVL